MNGTKPNSVPCHVGTANRIQIKKFNHGRNRRFGYSDGNSCTNSDDDDDSKTKKNKIQRQTRRVSSNNSIPLNNNNRIKMDTSSLNDTQIPSKWHQLCRYDSDQTGNGSSGSSHSLTYAKRDRLYSITTNNNHNSTKLEKTSARRKLESRFRLFHWGHAIPNSPMCPIHTDRSASLFIAKSTPSTRIVRSCPHSRLCTRPVISSDANCTNTIVL
ncbi:hypothetical protein RDWZM_005319 [Blomia tropicalis]|uniref:Uncharacterized protein n=1 Tax=Blomia tropicalis TaxID=40697 RepID=A0A9Q0M7P1_BLOTA|nr:hypothetical protein RDWZM_005319 [Blomia tropicalis]